MAAKPNWSSFPRHRIRRRGRYSFLIKLFDVTIISSFNGVVGGLMFSCKLIRRSMQLGPNFSLMLDLPTKIEEIKNGISLPNLLFIEA